MYMLLKLIIRNTKIKKNIYLTNEINMCGVQVGPHCIKLFFLFFLLLKSQVL